LAHKNLIKMIQRIQSLYLLLTTVLSILFLNGSFINFTDKTGSVLKMTLTGIVKSTEGQSPQLIEKVMPVALIIVLIAVLSLVTIFIFKKRNIQLSLSKILIGLVSGFILILCYYSYHIISEYGGKILPGWKIVLPFLLLIFSILAFRGIRKDDQLVKSYDRLR
jgi:hypothetical protein